MDYVHPFGVAVDNDSLVYVRRYRDFFGALVKLTPGMKWLILIETPSFLICH